MESGREAPEEPASRPWLIAFFDRRARFVFSPLSFALFPSLTPPPLSLSIIPQTPPSGARRPPRRRPQAPQLQAPRPHRHQDRHPARGQEVRPRQGPRRQRRLREVCGLSVGAEAGSQGGQGRAHRLGEVQGVGEEFRAGQGDQGQARMRRESERRGKRPGGGRAERGKNSLSFFFLSFLSFFSPSFLRVSVSLLVLLLNPYPFSPFFAPFV